jgi:hypothetical protein
MKNSKTKFLGALLSGLMLFLVPLTVAGQGQKNSLSGKYEGTAKSPDGDVQLTLDLTDEAGKLSGQVTSPHGVYKIVKGQIIEGVMTLEAEGTGSKGKITLRQKEDKLVGEFSADGRTGSVEFKRVVAKDEISGEWDATADANGQPFPFSLTLKVDGEKVTGSSSSELGTSPITSGSWKDGKLVFILDSSNGQIGMVATVVDGKLVGDFDYAGQMTGKWAAIKKKP